jgi:3-phenylpropionate/trans-cinnamate dioxygenase ferredoxin reductase subunit
MHRCVIVGGGHAAAQTAISLRQGGYEGEVRLITEEPVPPYQRPPLSKAFLLGTVSAERLAFRPEELYAKLAIQLTLSTRVASIDRDSGRVVTADGQRIGYDTLVLATGARPRRLPLPGGGLSALDGLRTLDDAQRLRRGLAEGGRIVIVGGGYIGLEVAATAATMGLGVTVLEAADTVLARVAGHETAEFVTALHRAHGVEIITGAAVTGFELGARGACTVCCADRDPIEADRVVLAVGVVPNDELAVDGGLQCVDGIVVDEHARTSDPAIFAVGDCTNHPNPLLGRRLRLESVHNALEQAKTAAASICGTSRAYAQIPWFWSDQYDVKLQTIGLAAGHERTHVTRSGDGSMTVKYLRGDTVLAVDCINAPRDFALSRSLFRHDLESWALPHLEQWSATTAGAEG